MISILITHFFLSLCCYENINSFWFALVSNFRVVCFVEVKFHIRSKFSVCFTQVSALECPLYRGNFYKDLTRKQLGPNNLQHTQ